MLKLWVMGCAVCVSLLGAGTVAAQKVDFDQGVDAKGVVPTPDAQDAKQVVPGTPAQVTVKTYQVSATHKKHGMGFIKKRLPHSDWVNWLTVGAAPAQVPSTFDLRPKLTQVEDQGQCGSCWAFSLTATNRDGHALGAGDPGRLSQEWLVDNSKEADGCNGGNFDSALEFITPKGQPLWSACPYQTGSGKCAADLKPAASITGWHMLGDPTKGPSQLEIESYMVSAGKPISIAVGAGTGDWMNYNGGVYNGCTMGDLDHMINIVGWDNEGAKFDATGNLPAGKGVWILRNSWGKSWGEDGYMRTKMSDAQGQRCNNVAGQAAFFDF
jgi:C1A family cysteine protease